MKLFLHSLLALLIVFTCSCNSNPNSNKDGITFKVRTDEKQIDVIAGEKLFTSFCWYDNVYKPILYPVYAASGTEITRGFPLKPREGESNDHRHQVGIWLTYGSVNGLDFWGNGSEGKWGIKSGQVLHLNVQDLKTGKDESSFISNDNWVDSVGTVILAEKTEYHFRMAGSLRIIDRITTLTAVNDTVRFGDTKEGMFGIRVTTQLQLPSKEDMVIKEKTGGTTTVKAMSDNEINGNYRSSEGVTGEGVWSTRARWMDLYGSVKGEKISLVVCDHPKNQSYPTYWHARGYGLFSANPLGAKDFTNGQEILNFMIPAGKSTTFRYRVIISSGEYLTDEQINGMAREFSEKY
jgi:hypothetical protein